MDATNTISAGFTFDYPGFIYQKKFFTFDRMTATLYEKAFEIHVGFKVLKPSITEIVLFSLTTITSKFIQQFYLKKPL